MRVRLLTGLIYLLMAFSANAQVFQQIRLNNKTHDLITLPVFAGPAVDRGENGEPDEKIHIFTSEGSVNETLSGVWGQKWTYAFLAKSSDITVFCEGVGTDGDEGCTFGPIRINAHSAVDNFTKDLARKATSGLLAGAVAVGAFGKQTGLKPVNYMAVALTLFAGATGWFASDPADKDFGTIAQPAFGTAPHVGKEMGRMQAPMNNVLTQLISLTAYAQAFYISSNRATGAFDAGDKSWEQIQLNKAAEYARAASVYAYGVRSALQSLLSNWNVTAINYNADSWIESWRRSMENPFDPLTLDVKSVLRGFGITEPDVTDLVNGMVLAGFPPPLPPGQSCVSIGSGCPDLPGKLPNLALQWAIDKLGPIADGWAKVVAPVVQ